MARMLFRFDVHRDPALEDTLPFLFGLLGIVEGLDREGISHVSIREIFPECFILKID
ncbi:MAG: hypothetical protein WBF03_08820 [Xanthobacteraceae bacterium]